MTVKTWVRGVVCGGVISCLAGCSGAAFDQQDDGQGGITPGPTGSEAPEVLTEPRWTVAPGLSDRRCDASVSLLADGRALVTGGRDPAWSKTAWTTADLFDPATDTWKSVAPMLADRSGHLQITLGDGRVLVAGGAETIAHPKGRVLELAEIFDPGAAGGAGEWFPTAPLPVPMSQVSGVLLADGRVLAVSPMGAALFDPSREAWENVSPPKAMSSARRLDDGRVLALHSGGEALLFDPAAKTWEAVEALTSPDGAMYARFLSSDGEPLVLANERLLAFDLATKSWVERETLAEAPANFGVTTHYGTYVPARRLHRAPDAKAVELPELPATPCGDHGITLRDGRLLLPGPEATLLLELPQTEQTE